MNAFAPMATRTTVRLTSRRREKNEFMVSIAVRQAGLGRLGASLRIDFRASISSYRQGGGGILGRRLKSARWQGFLLAAEAGGDGKRAIWGGGGGDLLSRAPFTTAV